MDDMKTCTLCGETKPISEFTKHKQMRDGYSYWCKICNNKRSKDYRDSPSGMYTALKGRLTFFHNKPFSISREEFLSWYEEQPKTCVYCDVSENELLSLNDAINNTTNRLTIECVKNEVGYFRENMALACRRCNLIKSDLFTFDEMREIGQKYVKPKWQRRLKESTAKRDEDG